MQNNKKMIYADDILSTLKEDKSINGANLRRVIQHINDAPAVEKVHGRWEKQLGLDHCSVCHKVRPYDVEADAVEYWQCNYCPNCGAKMNGGNEDG